MKVLLMSADSFDPFPFEPGHRVLHKYRGWKGVVLHANSKFGSLQVRWNFKVSDKSYTLVKDYNNSDPRVARVVIDEDYYKGDH